MEEKVAYTRVLMGHVDLARTVIPQSVKDTRIDILARNPLFLNGLDYLHGTGHGIGSFLSVHESWYISKIHMLRSMRLFGQSKNLRDSLQALQYSVANSL